MGDGAPVPVVIVDDSDDMRLLVRTLLPEDDFVVRAEVGDGTAAVELWRTGDHADAIWIVDQRMPHVSGLELAAHIRGDDTTTRILLLSAQLDERHRARAAELGVELLDKADIFDVATHLLP